MTGAEVDKLAKILWEYHQMGHRLEKADAILVLGSHDVRVAERGAQLYLDGLAPLLVFSGGRGKLTAHWELTEAETFALAAIRLGVPREQMLLEDRSTNTSENLSFTRNLLEGKGIHLNWAILVQKPYMERRAWSTCRKVWPELLITVTSPQIAYEDYPCSDISREDLIQIMVGDLQRLHVYAEKGYQVPQVIPLGVWKAWERLVSAGYTGHLIDARTP